MWCCFKPPDTKIEIPKWLNPEAPKEISGCLEDPPTPITAFPDSTETPEILINDGIIAADMVEPFILEHSTISMEPCEITEN